MRHVLVSFPLQTERLGSVSWVTRLVRASVRIQATQSGSRVHAVTSLRVWHVSLPLVVTKMHSV